MKQKGFTLIEVLVVTAIGGVLVMGIMLSIFNIVWGTSRSNSQVIVLTDVNHAALSIKKDLMMTQDIDLNPAPPKLVTLSWTDYTGFESENESFYHSSSYTLSSTELQRNYDGTVSIVGRNITYLGFTQNGKVINIVITATSSEGLEQSETLKFSAYIRAEEIE